MAAQTRSVARLRRGTARRLRENLTVAEVRLWRRLRRMPIEGSHFRRQVSIGPYIVDLACMAARLIVEVDGSQHGNEPNIRHDKSRTLWLEQQGFRVLRFWNSDIVSNLDGVVAAVFESIYGSIEAEPTRLKHKRRRKPIESDHPTPARFVRRPSPSRGG